jgi:hypothetical protein
MEILSATLRTVLKELEGKYRDSDQAKIRQVLEATLGKKQLGRLSICSLRKGALTVSVDSAAERYYIHLKKNEILKKFQGLDFEHQPKIEKLFVRLGRPT